MPRASPAPGRAVEGLDFTDWRAGILAADLADWITVAAYGVAAVLTARAAGRGLGWERAFWQLCTAAMLVLGINELFDFQTVLTVVGKAWARSQGIYEHRRTIQLVFVVALAAAAVVGAAAALVLTRKADPMVRLALLGLLFIGAFVLIRAASFHHVDELFGLGPHWFDLGSIQEVAGILIVAVAAYRYPARA